jgi:superfamily II DNA or RNA helicase
MIQFTVGNVFTKASSPRRDELNAVYTALSYMIPKIEIIRRKNPRLKTWDGRKSFFDRRNNTFLTGFLWTACAALKRAGIDFNISDTRTRPSLPASPDYANILHGITMRDYQVQAIEDFMKRGRGVVQSPTGSGKTEISIAISRGCGLKTLFLTHRAHLLHQTAKRFVLRNPDIKGKIGAIGDGIYEPNFITIATVQTIDAIIRAYEDLRDYRKTKLTPQTIQEKLEELKVKKHKNAQDKATVDLYQKYLRLDATDEMIEGRFNELIEFLNSIQLLIIDEAHRSGAKQFHRPAILCRNAFYRLALTATPFMKGNAQDDMFLLGVAGPVVAKVPISTLVEAGVVARPYFKFFDVTTPNLKGKSYRVAYTNGIVHNSYRNGIIVLQAQRLVKMDKKVLVIVNQVEHGQLLEDMMLKKGLRVAYQDGATEQHERERAFRHMQNDKLDVLIATNIYDEGVDCDVISGVILAAGNKSAPALFQRTGRAMRKKEENYAIVIDFIDRQHPNLFEHSQRRYELVKREKGFVIL